jgi:hypothetical protein
MWLITAAGSKGAAIGDVTGNDLERREQINPISERRDGVRIMYLIFFDIFGRLYYWSR